MADQDSLSVPKRPWNWKLILTILTFGVLAVMIYTLHKQVFDTIDNLGKVNAWALLFMIPFQALNYDAQTRTYRSLLRLLGERVRYRSLYRVALELNFVNNVFPSGGLSGFSYFSFRMRDAEVSAGKATLVQLMKFALLFISFQIMLFVGLLLLAIGGRVNNLTILVAGSLSTLLLALTVVVGYVIGSKQRIDSFFTYITKLVNRLIHIVRPHHPETINVARAKEMFSELHDNYVVLKKNYKQLRWPLLTSLMANLTEILTIYTVYVAFGHWVNPGAVIIAYAIANFAGLVSVLPGGVGIYEGLMTAVLATAGVSPGLSLPVTVMYRIINMLIQMPPGYFFYHKTLSRRPQVAVVATTPTLSQDE